MPRSSNPIAFVESLELGTPRKYVERLNMGPRMAAVESGEEAKAESYLSNKSIVSFVSNVSSQSRQDILSSTPLAQLAADKKFPDDTDLKSWFEVYSQTLEHIGWVVQGKDFSQFTDTKAVFEMEKVIVDVLSAALGGGAAIAIILKTLEAFKNLSDSDNKILAFEENTHTLTKGTLLIALCDDTNDSVAMKIGAFQLSSENTITQILFFKSSKEKTELSYSTSDLTFHKKAYDMVRTTIEQKLANVFNKYVSEIDI